MAHQARRRCVAGGGSERNGFDGQPGADQPRFRGRPGAKDRDLSSSYNIYDLILE